MTIAIKMLSSVKRALSLWINLTCANSCFCTICQQPFSWLQLISYYVFRPLEHFRSQKMCSNESPGFPSQKSHFPSSSTLRNCLCFSLAHYPALLEETTLLWTYDDSKPIFLNETTVCPDFLPHPKTLLLSPLLSFVSAAHLMLFLLTVGAVSGGYFPSSRWVITPSKARNGVLSFSAAQGPLLRMVAAHQYQCWLLCDIPEAFFVAVLSYLERLCCASSMLWMF